MSNFKNPFYEKFTAKVKEHGGLFNAHLHLDRAGTLDDAYMQTQNYQILENSHVSLHKKHSLINVLHEGLAFTPDNLEQRVRYYLDQMIKVNTRRADTMVDVTADNIGLDALQLMKKIKEDVKDHIDLQLASYSPFGFTDKEPERWDIFAEGVKHADFIGCLPEADDIDDYPEHIGFMAHCERVLDLANSLHKPVHFHTDQRNEPTESGTERVVQAIKQFGAPSSNSKEPMMWAVHAISPSTYDDKRFFKLVDDLVENNIGIICCPSAAIGMRQLRTLQTPTYNSIPRVLEMLQAGVQIRLASDNIADICSPTTTADLTDEVFVLSAALRFYNVNILAKLAAGIALNSDDKDFIKEHLIKNDNEIEKVLNMKRHIS